MKPDVLLLLSGGLDSMTLAAVAGDQLAATMTAIYPHPAMPQERRAVAAWRLARPSLPHHEVELPIVGAEAVRGSTGPRVIAARNLVLLAHAINVAAAHGYGRVWYGAQGGDQAEYDDCRPAFVAAVDALARPWGVTVEAPIIGWGKADVVREARRLGVPVASAWSCYEPDQGKPCGRCASCRARMGAE